MNDFYLMSFLEQFGWHGNNCDFYFLLFILVQPLWDALSMVELPGTEEKKSREPLEGQIMPFNSPTFC